MSRCPIEMPPYMDPGGVHRGQATPRETLSKTHHCEPDLSNWSAENDGCRPQKKTVMALRPVRCQGFVKLHNTEILTWRRRPASAWRDDHEQRLKDVRHVTRNVAMLFLWRCELPHVSDMSSDGELLLFELPNSPRRPRTVCGPARIQVARARMNTIVRGITTGSVDEGFVLLAIRMGGCVFIGITGCVFVRFAVGVLIRFAVSILIRIRVRALLRVGVVLHVRGGVLMRVGFNIFICLPARQWGNEHGFPITHHVPTQLEVGKLECRDLVGFIYRTVNW